MVGRYTDRRIGKDLEGRGRGPMQVLSRQFPGGTLRIAGVPAGILTQHLPNTSQEDHRYDKPVRNLQFS
jgi:hypothetical protein